MKLRELINRLEELSENGKNDDMEVMHDDLCSSVPVQYIFVEKDNNKQYINLI